MTALDGYALAFASAGALTVTPATLTITASNQSKVYGTSLNLGTTGFTETGLVTANGDSISGVTLASLGAASTANVGTYALSASNAQGSGLSNYNITYVDASTGLTVTPATLTITATNQSKVYGTTGNLGATGFTGNRTRHRERRCYHRGYAREFGRGFCRKCRDLRALRLERAGLGPVELQHHLCRLLDRPDRHARDADDHRKQPVQSLRDEP